MNRFSILFVLFLAAFSSTTKAQDTFINAAETLAFGTFTAPKVSGYRRAATRNSPPADGVEKYRFDNFTSEIPMEIGKMFGIEYQINTKPKGRPIQITTIIRFPDPGLSDPKGHNYLESKDTNFVEIGRPQLHGYGFDEDWELVPGKWVFEVWYKKAKLISKTFTVVEPTS